MASDLYEFGTLDFWLNWLGVLLCICMAALAAGLTMGLVAIEPFRLEILLEAKDKDCRTDEQAQELKREKQYAKKILPIISRHHLLLVTLLLLNSFANEALPLFLDRVVPTSVAIILSVTFVLVFGEILPAAVFTGPGQLAKAALFIPFVKLMMFILLPITWPISKILDYFLGEDEEGKFTKAELRALVKLHCTSETVFKLDDEQEFALEKIIEEVENPDELSVDEVTIINGAMDLKDLQAKDAMIPLSRVYMLDSDDILNFDCLVAILSSGHSRIPIYSTRRSNIRGLLLVKSLIVINPEENRKISQIGLREPIYVRPNISLLELLNKFQVGRSHMALVISEPEVYQAHIIQKKEIPDDIEVHGILTLEDVMERLIREPIKDETDVDKGVKNELFRAERLRRLSALAETELAKRTIKLKRSFSKYDDPDMSPSFKIAGINNKRTGSSLAYAIGKSRTGQAFASHGSYGSLEGGTLSPLNVQEKDAKNTTEDAATSPLLPKHKRVF